MTPLESWLLVGTVTALLYGWWCHLNWCLDLWASRTVRKR